MAAKYSIKNRNHKRRLETAHRDARHQIAVHLENRDEALREVVGRHYGLRGSSDDVPSNKIYKAVSTFGRQLAPRAPMSLVTSGKPDLAAIALKLQLALNYLIEYIELGKTLRKTAIDGITSMGIVKIGRSTGKIPGARRSTGQPFAGRVDMDDFTYDAAAVDFESASFIGNRYRVPYEWAMDTYKGPGRDKLKPAVYMPYTEEGTPKAETLSRADSHLADQYKQWVTPWDFWLPGTNELITFPSGASGEPIFDADLRTIEWGGPEKGPFKILSLGYVPNNAMPLPPVAHWLDLHKSFNAILNKTIHQAERQRNVGVGSRTNVEDGKRIMEVEDGTMVFVDDAGSAHEMSIGGPNQANMAAMMMLGQLFDAEAGNLSVLAGLSPQSQTASQDQLIAQNASKMVSDMQDAMREFTKEIVRDLAWWLFYDDQIDLPLTRRLDGTDYSVSTNFTASMRRGEFLDYNFDIDVYSMMDQTPQSRVQSVIQVITQLVIPMYPAMQQSGITVNFPAFLRMVAQYLNIPELNNILVFADQGQTPDEAVGDPPRKLDMATTRRYERVNRPAATKDGFEQAMMSFLMGKGQNNGESDRMFQGAA